MRFADHHELARPFLPPYALATFTLMSIPLGDDRGLILSRSRWLLISTTTSMDVIYEFMTSAATATRTGSVSQLAHGEHDQRHTTPQSRSTIMRERNMNRLRIMVRAGHFDINSGLIGRVFNGLDTRFVKRDIARRRARRGSTLRPFRFGEVAT